MLVCLFNPHFQGGGSTRLLVEDTQEIDSSRNFGYGNLQPGLIGIENQVFLSYYLP